MFTIETRRPSGRIIEHSVKPLQLIWNKFGDYYNLRNTVHVDDVNRNFALNPANGIKIQPFKKGHIEKYFDKELVVLTKYLILIKDVKDVTAVNHKVRQFFLVVHFSYKIFIKKYLIAVEKSRTEGIGGKRRKFALSLSIELI